MGPHTQPPPLAAVVLTGQLAKRSGMRSSLSGRDCAVFPMATAPTDTSDGGITRGPGMVGVLADIGLQM
jgi:hypothetical protein